MRIVNQGSGRALDVVDGDVRLWDADPARRQAFALRPAGAVLLPGAGRGLWRFHARAHGYSVITHGNRQLAADRLARRGARWALLPVADGQAVLRDRAGHRLTTEVLRP